MSNSFDQNWNGKEGDSNSKVSYYIVKVFGWIFTGMWKILSSWIKWLFINPDRRICPYCKTDIPYTATRCHRCRKDLKPTGGFVGRFALSMLILLVITALINGIMKTIGSDGDRESSGSVNVEIVESGDSIV